MGILFKITFLGLACVIAYFVLGEIFDYVSDHYRWIVSFKDVALGIFIVMVAIGAIMTIGLTVGFILYLFGVDYFWIG